MLTPQEVSSKTFPKAVMGGYAMAAVDEFLDTLTEDYGNLYKENAALKAKMKGLMEKIEEYRQIEDSMRSTLMVAQKMAKQIVSDAENKRAAITAQVEGQKASLVKDAEAAAQQRMAELKAEVAAQEQALREKKAQVAAEMANEEQKLERAKAAVSKFMQVTRINCEEQLKILSRLEEMVPAPVEVQQPAPAAQEAPEAPVTPAPEDFPVEAVAAQAEAREAAEEARAAVDAVESPAFEEELVLDEEFFTSPLPTLEDLKKVQAKSDHTDVDIQANLDELAVEEHHDQESIWDTLPEDATRVINLDDLQVGRNYNRDK